MAASRRELRKFGLLVGGIFAAWAIYTMFRRGSSPTTYVVGAGGAALLAVGAVAPGLLGVPYSLWMRLAAVLGWINTRILLAVMFFVVVTPLALVGRLFGRDVLDRRRRPPVPGVAKTYWHDHEESADPERYKRQF